MIEPAEVSPGGVDVFLVALEARLRAELARTPVALPARDLLEAGGKRLRARLLWWSACATAAIPPEPTLEPLVRAAAAIELAHLGSLVHDDIVDGGTSRRGVPTVHQTHGIRAATDAGAALAHLSNELVATLGPAARRAVRRAILATCRGQIRELALPFVPVTPRMRLAIMREKTGAFFELAVGLGAIVVGAAPRARAAMARFGRRFGVAFQIADDVLDLAGDPRELGRPNGADLREGVLTLPVLVAFERDAAVAGALARVRQTPDAASIAACADLVVRAGGVAAAADAAAWWLMRALAALQPLGTSHAADALAALARASIARGVRLGVPSFTESTGERHAPHVADPFVRHFDCTVADGHVLEPRLTHLLDWFHPGLATLVTIRLGDSGARAHRDATRRLITGDRPASAAVQISADAVALAHALSDSNAILGDPVRTLALVDALHCAAIGVLNEAPDAGEHRTVAEWARGLRGRSPGSRTTSPSFRRPAEPPSPSLSPAA